MSHVVSLDVDAPWCFIAVEDRKDHERLLLVEEVDGFLEELSDQLTFKSWQALDLPDLW